MQEEGGKDRERTNNVNLINFKSQVLFLNSCCVKHSQLIGPHYRLIRGTRHLSMGTGKLALAWH